MKASTLRHMITIEHPVETQDTYNQGVPTWETYATVRASMVPLRGQERFLAGQLHEDITARCTLRFIPGVTSKMRVRFCDELFDISAVINKDYANRELELILSTLEL